MSDDPMKLNMSVYEFRLKKRAAEEAIEAMLNDLVKECGYHVDVNGLDINSQYTMVNGRKAQVGIQVFIEMSVL
jgi:hypothetical protein